MTYKQLLEVLCCMSESQLACDLTVEDAFENQCFAADIRMSGQNHYSLDDNHPVIFYVYGRHIKSHEGKDGPTIAKEIGVWG